MARFFIDRPIFAWVIAIVIMLAGALSIRLLPVSMYPQIAPPAVVINASYPGASAKTVEATDGEPVVVDGPFVEAPEYVGGFWVIEAPDLDAALSWAARCPGAGHGAIEVRPVYVDPEEVQL